MLLFAEVVDIALAYEKEYGAVIRAWLGTKLVVFLQDPVDIEVILNSQVHINKSEEYRFFKPWLGEGLLISSGNLVQCCLFFCITFEAKLIRWG